MSDDSTPTFTRRQFTSTTALAALSAAIVPSRVLGGQDAPGNKLNIATVEDPIGALHSLEINRNHTQSLTEQEIAGRRVPMGHHLPIFPHAGLFAPAVSQPIQLIGFPLFDTTLAAEFFYQLVQVGAIL